MLVVGNLAPGLWPQAQMRCELHMPGSLSSSSPLGFLFSFRRVVFSPNPLTQGQLLKTCKQTLMCKISGVPLQYCILFSSNSAVKEVLPPFTENFCRCWDTVRKSSTQMFVIVVHGVQWTQHKTHIVTESKPKYCFNVLYVLNDEELNILYCSISFGQEVSRPRPHVHEYFWKQGFYIFV